jgi:hypothetical protein
MAGLPAPRVCSIQAELLMFTVASSCLPEVRHHQTGVEPATPNINMAKGIVPASSYLTSLQYIGAMTSYVRLVQELLQMKNKRTQMLPSQ